MMQRALAIAAASTLAVGVAGTQGASVSEYFDYDGTDPVNLNTLGSSGTAGQVPGLVAVVRTLSPARI